MLGFGLLAFFERDPLLHTFVASLLASLIALGLFGLIMGLFFSLSCMLDLLQREGVQIVFTTTSVCILLRTLTKIG
jgi:hypothetical protein